MLSARAISTSIYSSDMDFHRFILTHIGNELKEGQILAITSKLVSLAEKRLVSQNSINKKELVEKESDYYLGEIAYDCHLTIKHGQLIPSAGIDESNYEDGSYILYPITPYASAQKIHAFLSEELGIERFGILLTDSHTVALRRGVRLRDQQIKVKSK